MPKFDNNILENKAFLYVCFIITSISLIFFSKSGDPSSTAIFLISGYLLSLFTKKMAVVLLLALVISFIYKFGISRMVNYNYREGLTDSLNNSIDSIINDPKINEFLTKNNGHNNDMFSVANSLKYIISNLRNIIDKVKIIQNDSDYLIKAQTFVTDNSSYFNKKIETLKNEITKELGGKDIYTMVSSVLDITDRTVNNIR